jgi:hypothetical protein
VTGPVSPHLRPVNPDAEAARLAEERKGEPGPWFVRIDFPDGRFRRLAISDLLVRQAKMRPEAPGAPADVVDQVTVLRMAEAEIWQDA